MLASDPLLMPDQPGKGPPSSAPLSLEDVDRLAESFTPFWEDDEPAPAAAPAPAPAAPKLLGIAPIYISAAPAAPLPELPAPAPTPLSVTVPIPAQQAILAAAGLVPPPPPAPIPAPQIVAAAQPPPTPPEPIAAPAVVAPAQPVTVTQPLSPAAPALAEPMLMHKQTLLGYSQPPAERTPAATASAPPSAPRPQVPDVPGYAIAYTPKDGPSTPAVVIAPEARAAPAPRKPMAMTVRSRERPAPIATPMVSQSSALDDLDVYPKRKSPGVVVFVALGAVVVLLAVVGIRAVSGGGTTGDAAATSMTARPALPSPVSTAAGAAAPGPEPAHSIAPPPSAAQVATSEPPVEVGATSKTAPHRAKNFRAAPAPVAPKPAPTAAPAPTPREPSAASFPLEPSPPPAVPKATPSKGVIVRDTPF